MVVVIIQMRHLSIFGNIACVDNDADATMILTALPLENWKRPPWRPHHVAEYHPARSESLQPYTK